METCDIEITSTWLLDELPDGRISLTAPNGELLFVISPNTAGMLGQMLLDAAGDPWEEEL